MATDPHNNAIRPWWLELAMHALVSLILLAIVFPGVFLRGEVISPAGVLFQYAPWNAHATPADTAHPQYTPAIEYLCQWQTWYATAQGAWAAGEWPLWNPLQSTGVPLLANYQTAFFYPLRLPFACLDIHWAATIYILLKVWLTGLMAYIYARGIRLRLPGAYFISIAWMLSPLNLTWIYWCSSDVATWLPLQLLGIEFLLSNRKRAGFALIAVSGTLMLLAGHPETALTMAMGAGGYFFVRLFLDYRRHPATIARFSLVAAAGWMAAISVATVQLIPFLEYLRNSWTFAKREELESTTSAHLESLIAFVSPRFFGVSQQGEPAFWTSDINNSNFTIALYVGASVLLGILLLLSPAAWRSKHRTKMIAFLVPAALLFVAVFDHPVTAWLHVVPLLGAAWRFWFFPFVAFALVVVAALSLDDFLHVRNRARRLTAAGLSAILVAGIWLYFVVIKKPDLAASTAHAVQIELAISTCLLLATMTLVAIPMRSFTPSARYTVLAIMLAIDLLAATRGILPTMPRDRICPPTELTEFLREQNELGRTFIFARESQQLMPPGIVSYYGIEEFFGYDGMQPYRIGRWYLENLIFGRMWRVQSARYRLEPMAKNGAAPPAEVADARHIKTIEGIHIYEDAAVWPRVRLLPAARVVNDLPTMYDQMRAETFDPARAALVESPLPLAMPETSDADPGTATVVDRTMNSVTIETEVRARSILLLTDQFYPGWTALVDGNPVDVFPVYALFRGVQLEPGAHRVEFRYTPVSFRIGLATSSATLLVASLIALILIASKRKRRPFGHNPATGV